MQYLFEKNLRFPQKKISKSSGCWCQKSLFWNFAAVRDLTEPLALWYTAYEKRIVKEIGIKMGNNPLKVAVKRMTGVGIPSTPEVERFGMDGEEVIAKLLWEHFDCVIRNLTVPHKELYLEKDFAVIADGVIFVLEVKNWKGEIGAEGDKFYQDKDNGTRKTIKSPVGTTRQFISRLQSFYKLLQPVVGVVVFAEPDCRLSLPEEMDGIALIRAEELVAFIKSRAKLLKWRGESIDPKTLLRCTRFYSRDREFCKGILADIYLDCYTEDGSKARLDTTRLRYLTAEHQPLRLRDKLYVTYDNGATGVFYSHDTVFTVGCLDGSFRKLALNRIRHIVF